MNTTNNKTLDGKFLNNGDTFFAICSDTKMTSSGYQKVVPIELSYPEDWDKSGNGVIAYFSKKECLKECKRRNVLELNKGAISSSNIVEFQIEENWGDGCKGFIYFSADRNTPIEKLKEIAKNEAKKDWEKICEVPKILGSHTPFRPTILVSEYADRKRVRSGISFKTKWR